jgi:hypothetical protein
MDELALQFQRTHDKKIIAQIFALSRLLARMKDRMPDRKNRSEFRADILRTTRG